ncbi:MAG: T9SS type A sorting domain-containing protein [Bacteroidia bacterium]|nr:T9SS type A sorting domain-containing protein [Bacteroidia bacterium]
MKKLYLKIFLIAFIVFTGGFKLGFSQVSAVITIANENISGSDYFFDVYIHEGNASSGPVYLGDSQFRISFDNSKFTNPGLHQLSNPSSLFGQEDGYGTFVPSNTDGAFNDAITRNNYYNSISVSIPNGRPNILNIELNGPGPGNQNAFDTRVAKIDNNQLTHRLGRYRISGFKGSGDPNLSLVTTGSFSTALLSYGSSSPWNTSLVSISAGTLPVEWMSFTATNTNNQEVKLFWITAWEINNDRFVIEKKLEHGDFTDIASLASKGNSNSPQSYTFYDNSPMTERVYYRIKQIDLNGTADYSNTLEVQFDWGKDQAYILYPSPAEHKVSIETYIQEERDHAFWVLDLRGKEMINGKIKKGNSIKKLNIEELPAGNYFVKIQGPNDSIHYLKFTKKN